MLVYRVSLMVLITFAYLVCRMGHSSSEVGVLKKLEEIKAVWIPVTE